MPLYNKQVPLVLGGVLLQVLLHRGFYMVSEAAILDFKTYQIAEWYTFIVGPLWSLVIVLPAFAVGYLAARNGLLLGATIGALSSIVYFLTFNYHWADAPLTLNLTMLGPILPRVIVDAFSAAIVPAFACSSGEFLRVRRAP